jgi:hypothetical protein
VESWIDIRANLRARLIVVKAESDSPDLWEIARTNARGLNRATLHLSEPSRNTRSIAGIASQYVRAKMAYLTEAAGRVGRFDWKNLAASTFTQIVLELALTQRRRMP